MNLECIQMCTDVNQWTSTMNYRLCLVFFHNPPRKMILKVFAKSLFLLQGDMDQHARDNALYAFKHGKAKARWWANDVIHRVQKKGTIYPVNLKIPPPRERIKQKACVMNLIFNAVFLIELFQLRWFPGFGCHRCCSTWLGHQKCWKLRCLTDSRWVMENHRGSRRDKVQYVINYDAPANMEEPVMNLDRHVAGAS